MHNTSDNPGVLPPMTSPAERMME